MSDSFGKYKVSYGGKNNLMNIMNLKYKDPSKVDKTQNKASMKVVWGLHKDCWE